MEKNEIHIVNT